MKIVRAKKKTNYTVLNNYHFSDKRLSLKSIGLMDFILHLPEDWDINTESLNSVVKDGKSAITSALNELEECGYLVRKQDRNQEGKFSKTEYILYEEPNTDFSFMELPQSENHEHINTINKNTIYKSTINKNKKNIIKEKFEAFWNAYPKKKNKAKTQAWFEKNKPDEELMEVILSKLDLFKKTTQWQKDNGQYIPLPTSWLNGRRWEDELSDEEIEMTEEEFDRLLHEEAKRRGLE